MWAKMCLYHSENTEQTKCIRDFFQKHKQNLTSNVQLSHSFFQKEQSVIILSFSDNPNFTLYIISVEQV